MLFARSAALVALVVCAAGCQNQQAMSPNPFLTASKVPPPATRLPAQAPAQPYYPTDVAPMTSGATYAPVAPSMNPQLAVASQQVVGASGETPIGLPQDNQPARFALTSATVAMPAQAFQASHHQPMPAAAGQPTNQPAAQPTSPPFTPAPADAALAWNSNSAPRTFAASAQQVTPASATVVATPPRIRLPGATAMAYNSQMQVDGQVQIQELPPAGAAPYIASADVGDGFQPRGATVRRPPTPVMPRGVMQ